MKAIFGWLLRSGVLYLLLFLAIGFYVIAWPKISTELSGDALRKDAMSVAEVGAELKGIQTRLQTELDRYGTEIRQLPADKIKPRLAAAKSEQAQKRRLLDEQAGWFDAYRPTKIVASNRLALEIAALGHEIAALNAALKVHDLAARREAANGRLEEYRRIPTKKAVQLSNRRCEQATDLLKAFDRRNPIDRTARDIFLGERESLSRTRTDRCDQAKKRDSLRKNGLEAREAAIAARKNWAQARNWVMGKVPDRSRAIASNTLRDIAVMALLALLAIFVTPYLIRLFFWFVLAPIAERRSAIRLSVPGGHGRGISASARSAPSAAVTLAPGEELLVRQDFLQTSPIAAKKATQWLLDWRHPLSSMASGMRFLTRLRGDGSVTTVSASDDPFAEVAVVTIPDGSSCTLYPRSLAALVQPRMRPLRITSHWRLFSMNAWLTLQLRFLVFHGPARLVVIGGRGVRVEQAELGRIFAPDQLIGFSADLGYSVIRNETFWPYFFGIESLLRDRVTSGEGVLIVEESPMAGRKGGGVRRGLEGAIDAAMKTVGL